MLYKHFTEKILGLQDIEIEKVDETVQDYNRCVTKGVRQSWNCGKLQAVYTQSHNTTTSTIHEKICEE